MELHPIDTGIIVLYLLGMVAVGFVVERRARRGMSSYFLGGNEIPWWVLSMSNAASMFDISGTMWLVYLLFVYGLKSVFIPWLWPVFNQIFLMVYLSAWLRRSGAITGAEWITLRFGNDRGAEASRISVVIFALTSVIAFTGYAYIGIKEFAAIFLPASIPPDTYAIVIIGITTLYTVIGGLYSVVLTDLIQFVIMIVSSIALGVIAMWRVSPETLATLVPKGWTDISFGWLLHLDWSHLMPAAQEKIAGDGYTLFGAFFGMTVFKGILVSMAGPAPNYDMQRVLAAKSPREASMMSGFVTVALYVPRYFMIAGITVLAFARSESSIDIRKRRIFRTTAPAGNPRFRSGRAQGIAAGWATGGVHVHFCCNNQRGRSLSHQRRLQALPSAPCARARIHSSKLRGIADCRRRGLCGWSVHPVGGYGDQLDCVGTLGWLCRGQRIEMALVATQRMGLLLGNDGGHRRCNFDGMDATTYARL